MNLLNCHPERNASGAVHSSAARRICKDIKAVHHCYVRATVGKERMPIFSMMVRTPEPEDLHTAAGEIAARQGEVLVNSPLVGG